MNVRLKRFLHKFFKIFIIFLLGTAFINLVLLLCVYGNHRKKLKEEAAYLTVPGQLVSVNGHDMHVMEAGNPDAEITLVFMHSSKVVDDSVALQPLFQELGDEYSLVYVERSGFGFSENSESSRDIDTILEETRSALSLSGHKGPYILVSSGTSGVEAIHWANKYPDEVVTIIGINMSYPEQFETITTEEYCGFFDYLMVGFGKIGGLRLVKGIYPDNTFGIYTDIQMQTRNALVSRGGYTKDMYNEDLAAVDNAAEVAKEGWPEQMEMYLIYANPLEEPYVNEDSYVNEKYQDALEGNSDVDYVNAYNESIREYFEAHEKVTLEEMAGPSRLYTYNPAVLAEKIKKYISANVSR